MPSYYVIILCHHILSSYSVILFCYHTMISTPRSHYIYSRTIYGIIK
jgi:hypothetical protein